MRVAHRVDLVGVVDIDLDDVGLAVEIEIVLRLGERHEDEGAVEGRHADLEDRARPCRLFMRGVTPNGVCAPCGAISVILSPTRG